MEKNIWIYNKNKQEIIAQQQMINKTGGLRSVCILSMSALNKMIEKYTLENMGNNPSVFLVDHKSSVEDGFEIISLLQSKEKFQGIPLVFMVDEPDSNIEKLCYNLGAVLLLYKPFTEMSILRIERLAWQHEKTKNYEKILQKQLNELLVAKRIKELNAILESRNKLLRQIFGRYFSEEITECILENPEGAKIGGRKCVVTVMFADLRGFTAISENVTADVTTEVINNFLGSMTEIIFEFKGSVIEFIGDAILAIFGAPLESENPNEDAIAAAIKMQNAMKDVNVYNKKMGYPRIEMGIGIHTGEVFLGNIGSEKMMRYNVIGASINLCSRIESCSVGGQVLLSQSIVEEVTKKDLLKLDIINETEIMMKGISGKVKIFDIIGIHGLHEYSLDKIANEECIPLKKEVDIEIYKISEKEISEECIKAVLKAMSNTCALLEIQGEHDFNVLDEIEIVPIYKADKAIIKYNYAKIVWKKNKQVMIRYNTCG